MGCLQPLVLQRFGIFARLNEGGEGAPLQLRGYGLSREVVVEFRPQA